MILLITFFKLILANVKIRNKMQTFLLNGNIMVSCHNMVTTINNIKTNISSVIGQFVSH